MNYRDFGTTGIQVSELVLGGGAVGGLFIYHNDETKLATLRRSMKAGINWIDTAPSYGQGRSEEAFGWLLKEIEEDPYISTKVGIDTENLSDIPGQIERSVEASLNRLKCDSVFLLQLHNQIGKETQNTTIAASEVLRKGGVLDGLQRMKEQGFTQHIGITALGEAPSILEIIESGRIESAQIYYNLLNPSAGMNLPEKWPIHSFSGILDACQKHGVATMNIRVFSGGVLLTKERTGREVTITHDTIEIETLRTTALFNQLGTVYGTRAQSAIRFSLAQTKLSCVVFGLAEPEHLEEALVAEEKGPLSSEALEKIQSVYQLGVNSNG